MFNVTRQSNDDVKTKESKMSTTEGQSFGTMADLLGAPTKELSEKRHEKDAPVRAVVNAVLEDGGSLFTDEELEELRNAAQANLHGERQRSSDTEIAAKEIADQIRALENELAPIKAIPGYQTTKFANRVKVAEETIKGLRKKLAEVTKDQVGMGKSIEGTTEFRTMRDTLQRAFEVLGGDNSKATEQQFVEANRLYNLAMAMAIRNGNLTPFVDGKVCVGNVEVVLEDLRNADVTATEKRGNEITISRDQREVVYGRGTCELDEVEYNMYRNAYWAAGAMQKPAVQGMVRSFRILNMRLRDVKKILDGAKGVSRKEMVERSTLSAQDVLDWEKDGLFAAFFPWRFRNGTMGDAFLACEVKDGVVKVVDAQTCLRRDDIGIAYEGRLDSRLFGILRRLANPEPRERY